MVKYSESGCTAGGCLALVPGKLDWSPGVASRHEVGILPCAWVNGACKVRSKIMSGNLSIVKEGNTADKMKYVVFVWLS